jgi:hypothetical protein
MDPELYHAVMCVYVLHTDVNKNMHEYRTIFMKIQEDYMAMYCLWQSCSCSWNVQKVMVKG